MPSLFFKYNKASKIDKGNIIEEIARITRAKYPTVRSRILNENFCFGDQKLIAEYYGSSIEELFPEHVKIPQS